jgi:hypothetical protein
VNEAEKRIRLEQTPSESTIRIAAAPSVAKAPRLGADPGSIWSLSMTWCTTLKDVVGSWSWGQPREWTVSQWDTHICPTLTALTQLTWQEIELQTSGRNRKHHPQSVSSICKEARDRWVELEIESDVAYRFRLTGTQRAWGYRMGAHFHFIWYDEKHKIYPVEKRNT